MPRNFRRTLAKHSIWLSLLIHGLLFVLLAFVFVNPSENRKPPGLYIPSYTAPDVAPSAAANSITHNTPQQMPEKKQKEGLLKPTQAKASAASKPVPRKHTNQFREIMPTEDSEPIHMIGDKNISDPLAVLLGKAITAKLIYPRIAYDFQLKGTVLVGFNLHPNGRLTNIQLVKSSQTGVLDQAALDAFQAVSPVERVSRYVKTPTNLVIGIIFQ